jgi:hypothetical protein
VEIRYVYEAGPTGFALCRHLRAKGIVCAYTQSRLTPELPDRRRKRARAANPASELETGSGGSCAAICSATFHRRRRPSDGRLR